EMKVEYMTFFMELRRREEKGREEGREEGRWTTLAELVREGILSLQEAAKKAGMSEEHFRKLEAL
ncbi:MAG: hypothetical protein MR669_05160, partial [Selenomonadaceae bacterium]|nr:hypothetical protein [Selenomonadaceae bacterium]